MHGGIVDLPRVLFWLYDSFVSLDVYCIGFARVLLYVEVAVSEGAIVDADVSKQMGTGNPPVPLTYR